MTRHTALRVCHVITGLDVGGAEMMLCKVASRLQGLGQHHAVVSLTTEGALGARIRDAGIEVRALHLGRRYPNPFLLIKLARWLRELKPDVIQTWLYHADLVGGVAARLAGRVPVVWGVRQSNLERSVNKPRTMRLARVGARLSRGLPSRIICCSEASRTAHVRLGYDDARMAVIPNGFDLTRFRPDPVTRGNLREALGLAADTVAIGLFARFDPQKDHHMFLRAAARMAEFGDKVRFVMAGEHIVETNPALAAWIGELGLNGQALMLGRRDDMPALMAAMDIVASSSVGEGFPNVIGEAMASGVPCAVTDVGDTAFLAGDTGRVVPAGDDRALAAAWRELIVMGAGARRALGAAARARVAELFDIEKIAARYGELYERTTADVRTRGIF